MFSSTRAIQVLLYCCDGCFTYLEDKGRTRGHLLILKLSKNYFSSTKENTELNSESSYAQKEGQKGVGDTEKTVLLTKSILSGQFNRVKKPS